MDRHDSPRDPNIPPSSVPVDTSGQAAFGSMPPPPPSAPRKRMSSGSKWAIGLGAAFVLIILASCGLMATSLGAPLSSGLGLGERVAVIHIDDAIAGTTGITPEDVLDQLDQALDDDSVKAIVLRVDSPGGTVAASQEIMMAVDRATEDKPVVTSVGDVCASGAYMVASQSDEIIAAPGSTVGSIGVILQLVNAEELLDKVGLEFTTLTQGEYKDAGSPYRSVTETETAMLNEQMRVVYDRFIEDVAEGRGISKDKVRELATGWAWLGSEALDLGLVDALGNYDDAIDRAAELGGIEGEPGIITYEKTDPFADLYSKLLGQASGQDGAGLVVPEGQISPR